MPVLVYADGSCGPNPGPGGYCAIIINPDATERLLTGSEERTTNNRMELMAAIVALEQFRGQPRTEIEVRSDSEYLVLGMRDRIDQWKENGWRTRDRKPVKNQDLWTRLDALAVRHNVTWTHVRGHNGDPINERADRLAREAAVLQIN